MKVFPVELGGVAGTFAIIFTSMKPAAEKIVSDGAKRLREAQQIVDLRARLLAAKRLQHASELKRAAFWRRLWIEFKIDREVSAALDEIAPKGALHLSAPLLKRAL